MPHSSHKSLLVTQDNDIMGIVHHSSKRTSSHHVAPHRTSIAPLLKTNHHHRCPNSNSTTR
eukprot:scaffold107559_cov23-Cyclotella_meneghiniana.AAC.1